MSFPQKFFDHEQNRVELTVKYLNFTATLGNQVHVSKHKFYASTFIIKYLSQQLPGSSIFMEEL